MSVGCLPGGQRARFEGWGELVLQQHIRRFLLVGSVGFVVDLAVMAVLFHGFSVDPLISRLAAFVCAVLITYVLNSRYTYEIRARDANFGRYLAVQIIGAAINLGVFAWLVVGGLLEDRPMVALVCGAMLATFSNFALARRFVFLRP